LNKILTPKAKRNVQRIIPFGLIWLLNGWVFMLVELAAMGSSAQSSTVIDLTLPVFVFASVSVTIVGLLVGTVELLLVGRLFRSRSFISKIFYKFMLYAVLMLLIISITYPIAASFESGIPVYDQRIWSRFGEFLFSVTFLSTSLQMSASIALCLIYAAISENLGHNVFVNFLSGKYHRPRDEERIFMFLDMKSSTTFAEKLGHMRYFKLLQDYYNDLSDAIINHAGEVYQYIGDEVVITWNRAIGLKDNKCINCFFAMKASLRKRADYYKKHHGVVPSFKAAIHVGSVTTGEIGALKKDVFFTGDVLNVTSRIQSLCNQLDTDLLISDDLLGGLNYTENLQFKCLGETKLKGKSAIVVLHAVQQK